MNKYLSFFIGAMLFFLFIIIADFFDRQIQYWVSQTFIASNAYCYSALIKFTLIPIATTSLGLNRMICATGFDWKLFLLFFAMGTIFIFNMLIIPLIPVLSMSLVSYSKFGGVIIGIGIILSIKTKT